jgi:hypothetical protein
MNNRNGFGVPAASPSPRSPPSPGVPPSDATHDDALFEHWLVEHRPVRRTVSSRPPAREAQHDGDPIGDQVADRWFR